MSDDETTPMNIGHGLWLPALLGALFVNAIVAPLSIATAWQVLMMGYLSLVYFETRQIEERGGRQVLRATLTVALEIGLVAAIIAILHEGHCVEARGWALLYFGALLFVPPIMRCAFRTEEEKAAFYRTLTLASTGSGILAVALGTAMIADIHSTCLEFLVLALLIGIALFYAIGGVFANRALVGRKRNRERGQQDWIKFVERPERVPSGHRPNPQSTDKLEAIASSLLASMVLVVIFLSTFLWSGRVLCKEPGSEPNVDFESVALTTSRMVVLYFDRPEPEPGTAGGYRTELSPGARQRIDALRRWASHRGCETVRYLATGHASAESWRRAESDDADAADRKLGEDRARAVEDHLGHPVKIVPHGNSRRLTRNREREADFHDRRVELEARCEFSVLRPKFERDPR